MEWFFDLGKRHIHWTGRYIEDMFVFVDPAKSKPAEISELVVLHCEAVARAAYCGSGVSSDKLGDSPSCSDSSLVVVLDRDMASFPRLEVIFLHRIML